MASKANVTALRQQLEQLFPGKWLVGQEQGSSQKLLRTGIGDIDAGIVRGLPRRAISEWSGAASSGKTTLLRSAIAYWCLSGLNVAYIDTFSRLVAADWAFVEQGICGAMPINLAPRKSRHRGRFMAVRVSQRLDATRKGEITRLALRKEACWVAEQLIKCALFDVVVFDLGGSSFVNDRVYARLHRSLERSRTALILLKDNGTRSRPESSNSSWGAQTRASFQWGDSFSTREGIDNSVMIVPSVKADLARDGLGQRVEIGFSANVSNSLFTYPQIPDRRTSKTRPRTKG